MKTHNYCPINQLGYQKKAKCSTFLHDNLNTANFFSEQPHENRHKQWYAEVEIKRCDLGAKMAGGEGGKAALQQRDPENKSVKGEMMVFYFRLWWETCSRGHSMPGNKHKHLLIEGSAQNMHKEGKKGMNIIIAQNIFLPSTDNPAADKHLHGLLWWLRFTGKISRI